MEGVYVAAGQKGDRTREDRKLRLPPSRGPKPQRKALVNEAIIIL